VPRTVAAILSTAPQVSWLGSLNVKMLAMLPEDAVCCCGPAGAAEDPRGGIDGG